MMIIELQTIVGLKSTLITVFLSSSKSRSVCTPLKRFAIHTKTYWHTNDKTPPPPKWEFAVIFREMSQSKKTNKDKLKLFASVSIKGHIRVWCRFSYFFTLFKNFDPEIWKNTDGKLYISTVTNDCNVLQLIAFEYLDKDWLWNTDLSVSDKICDILYVLTRKWKAHAEETFYKIPSFCFEITKAITSGKIIIIT